uniref:Uncharacterized protein n=1 Tax=Salix viminalis TaxID=40686 RepID=A0A6N2MCX5_SALVM
MRKVSSFSGALNVRIWWKVKSSNR